MTERLSADSGEKVSTTNKNGAGFPAPFLSFQKIDVFVNRRSAQIANSCQFADVELSALVSGIAQHKAQGNRLQNEQHAGGGHAAVGGNVGAVGGEAVEGTRHHIGKGGNHQDAEQPAEQQEQLLTFLLFSLSEAGANRNKKTPSP